MSRAFVARAPTRIDFGGGWTDVPPYTSREGGAVCNLAIARYATATAARGEHAARQQRAPAASPDALVDAALRRAGIAGARASVSSDFPVGAGLGGSAAAGVALAGALALLSGTPLDRTALAEQSRATEVNDIGVAGGYQDHYAAAFGGALLLSFDTCIGVEQLPLTPDFAGLLARRVLLVYTGESRLSGDTITAVLDAFRARERRVCDALARMKALAIAMGAALRDEDLDALGALVGEHWTHQRALHPTITTPRIDAIMSASARCGALGGKALGASGGGCVIVISGEAREDELATALAPLGERLPWSVDEGGFEVMAALTGEEP